MRQHARRRPEIGHPGLNLLIAAWMIGVLNAGFWDRLAAIFAGAPFRAALFGGAIFALTVLFLELLGPGRLQKPAAAALWVIAAAAGHYERTLDVLIDREMVRNLFGTTAAEARHLITPTAVARIALTGLLPAALVFWLRVRRVGRWHQLWRWPLGVAVSFALLAGGLMLDFKAFSSVLRKRQDLMGARISRGQASSHS